MTHCLQLRCQDFLILLSNPMLYVNPIEVVHLPWPSTPNDWPCRSAISSMLFNWNAYQNRATRDAETRNRISGGKSKEETSATTVQHYILKRNQKKYRKKRGIYFYLTCRFPSRPKSTQNQDFILRVHGLSNLVMSSCRRLWLWWGD